jgi:hypothetical protein
LRAFPGLNSLRTKSPEWRMHPAGAEARFLVRLGRYDQGRALIQSARPPRMTTPANKFAGDPGMGPPDSPQREGAFHPTSAKTAQMWGTRRAAFSVQRAAFREKPVSEGGERRGVRSIPHLRKPRRCGAPGGQRSAFSVRRSGKSQSAREGKGGEFVPSHICENRADVGHPEGSVQRSACGVQGKASQRGRGKAGIRSIPHLRKPRRCGAPGGQRSGKSQSAREGKGGEFVPSHICENRADVGHPGVTRRP